MGLIILIVGVAVGLSVESNAIVYAAIVIGLVIIISAFLMIIKQYERAIILRLGRYHRQVGPGVQTRIPFVDGVLVVDVREKVREFKAERMLTKDNVPVTIDAILRYRIIEDRARDAILNVENFNQMIQQVSQTTLRNNIGSSVFQDILSKREEVNQHIKSVIAGEASNWGIEVTGVEIRQVIIPQELEAAMSMQAQAEREKSARVTYGESEVLVAKQFEVLHELVPAAATMALLENPTSTAATFRLREFQEAARALRLDLRVRVRRRQRILLLPRPHLRPPRLPRCRALRLA